MPPISTEQRQLHTLGQLLSAGGYQDVPAMLRASLERLVMFLYPTIVVLLSAPDEDSARAAFERFRHAVESHYFIGIGRSTVSIGFSDVRAGDTPQACFDRADKAVYYGKTHGRNQVCSQLALVAAGELEDNMKFGSVELF